MLDQCVADQNPPPGPDSHANPSRPVPKKANRQQGKTTTLSKFIAALSVGSICGGNLCFVYSTGLDRAQEVVKAARGVIDWLRTTTHVETAGYAKIRIVRDNERMFAIQNPIAGVNVVAARPRTVESCRGDNPFAVVVDEIAFTKKDWYYRFLQPLPQVRRLHKKNWCYRFLQPLTQVPSRRSGNVGLPISPRRPSRAAGSRKLSR